MESRIIIHMGEFDTTREEMFISSIFRQVYKPEWILSDYAKRVIKEIDKSEVLGEHVILSPILGAIPPERLSGGTQTLIAAYFNKDKVYPLENLGDNCAEMLYIGALDGPTNWYYTGYNPIWHANQKATVYSTGVTVSGGDIGPYLRSLVKDPRDLIKYTEE